MAENKENIVEPGKFVAYSYKLYDDATGELLFETPAAQPDVMVYGVSEDVVPGLITVMNGLKAGDKFEVTLPPQVAFGEVYPDNILELDKEIFMRDGETPEEVKVGARLPMMTAEGFRVIGRILEIGDKVKMDFNHPYAGLTVRYDGKIEKVRDATPEELKPAGGGCCGGCGGSCGDGSCGDHECGSEGCGCSK